MKFGCIFFTLFYFALLGQISSFTVSVLYPNFINDWGWTYRQEISRSNANAMLFKQGYDIDFVLYSNISYGAATQLVIDIADKTDIFLLTSAGYYEEAISVIGDMYPTKPVISLTGKQIASSVNLFPRSYQGYYLAGIYCGSITKTNNIGHFGINPIQSTVSEVNAFYIGAKRVNKDITVKYGFMDDFYSPQLERNAGKQILDSWNIDCGISQSYDVNRIWADNNVTVVGIISDMRYLIGENVHFSILYDWTQLYYKFILDAVNGNFTGGQFIYSGIGDVIQISHFSTIADIATKNKLVQEATNLTSIFCPPFYDHCLSDYEIVFMSEFLEGPVNQNNFTLSYFLVDLFVDYSSPSGIVIITLAVLGILVSTVSITLTSVNIETKTIHGASPLFCYLVISGCVLGFVSTFFWLGEPTVVMCQLRIWIGSLAYSLALGALVMKNLRIMILYTKQSLKKIKVDNKDLFLKAVVPLILMEFIFLSLWTSLDIYEPKLIKQGPFLTENERYLVCGSNSDWGFSVFLALKAVLFVIGVIVSYKVRKIEMKDYNESNTIGLTIYNTALIFVVAVIVLITVPFDVTSNITVIAIAIIIVCLGIDLLLFVPKFLRIYKQHDKSTESRTNNFRTSEANTSNKA
jgi:basic membrane lipoprotein Med (substrate-binding protein (PBP1-ABC) superfamily)